MNRLAAFLALIACVSAINVGYFAATGLMAVSTQEKFYQAAGVDVNFVLVPGSIVAFQWLADGTIDGILTAVDNSINRYYNRILNTTLLSGGDLAPDYVLVGTNGVKTIADLRGKTIIVDSTTSGFSALIQRVLFNNGLVLNQDYTFTGYGGTPLRYEALVNGKTNTNATAYCALMTFPYTAQIESLNRSDIFFLARMSDYVAPYQSIGYAILTDNLKNNTAMELNTRFLEGYYLAYLFANNTNNKAKVIADLSAYLNISTPVATASYGAIRNPVSGEVVNNLYLSPMGILNVVAIRQQFGGFTYNANFSAAQFPVQQGGALINYTALVEAQRRALIIANGAASGCQATVTQTSTNHIFYSTYTVTVQNAGNTPASPVIVAPLLAAGVLDINQALQKTGFTFTQAFYTLKAAPLAAGKSATFSYNAINMIQLTVSQTESC